MTSVKPKWYGIAPGLSKSHLTGTVHGQLVHLIGPAQPLPERPPSFRSIYLYDADNEEKAKMRYGKNLDLTLLESLTNMLHDVYRNVHTFRALSEWVVNDSYPVS